MTFHLPIRREPITFYIEGAYEEKIEAEMALFNDRCILTAGSMVRIEETSCFVDRKNASYRKRKNLILQRQLLKQSGRYILQNNIDCTSPTQAAEIVLGRIATGPGEWKDKKGVPLNARLRNDFENMLKELE